MKSNILGLAGHVAHIETRRGAYRVLVGKSEGQRPFGKHIYRWDDNIKMDLQEVGWEHGLNRCLRTGTSGGVA
jgi:hypothetical protein